MCEAAKLLNMIKKYDLVLTELNLYLDTHSRCQNAIGYFKKYKELREKAYNEYITKYGPITFTDSDPDDSWPWVDGPWPWERGAD